MQPRYRLEGRVVDERGTALSQVHVEVWDKDLMFHDFVGYAESDPTGSFQVEFNERYFRELFQRRPDVYLKVRLQGIELPAETLRLALTLPNGEQRSGSGATVLWRLAPGTTTVLIEAGEIPVAADFKLVGRLTYANGHAAAGLRVRAFDKDLRTEQLLGEGLSDPRGGYEITYTASAFRRSDKLSADLIARAYDANGSVLTESSVVFNAKPIETIDLVLTGEPASLVSEYELLLDAIAPVLEGLAPVALSDDDIAFLVGETGADRGRLVSLRAAARLATAAAQADLSTEIFYGLARLGLPTSSLAELLGRSLPSLLQALRTAIEKHLIPATVHERLDAIAAALAACMAHQSDEPPAAGVTSFAALLVACPTLTSDKRDRLLQVLASFRGDPQTFFAELSRQPEFAADPHAVDDLRITLQFGVLSRNHLPLVIALHRLRAGTLPGQPPLPTGEARDLARLTTDEWLQITRMGIDGETVGFPPETPGADEAEKAANYAEHLFRSVEAAYPTAAASHQLARADRQLWPLNSELATFLQDNPDFDLRTTRLDLRWMSKLPTALTRSASKSRPAQEGAEQDAAAVQELRTLQRLFHVSPRFSQINALRQAGFSSARSVTRLTRAAFIAQHAAALGGDRAAAAAYEAAAQRVGVAAQVWGQYSHDFDRALPAYIPRTPTPPAAFEKIIPNWSKLFGSLAYCPCQHCRSIYSPAAYLVELLQFIRNETRARATGSSDTGASGSGLEALRRRRPDLEQIELSCANTNTPLPYVDLVNEILERVIADAQATPAVPQHVWPQTTWTAAELAANPQHERRSVYDSVLSRSVFPWDLPFDLSAGEAQVYLTHLGVSRSQLLETFFKPASEASDWIDDNAVAREYLGMSATEWDLIGGGVYGNEPDWHALWGLDAECRANGEPLAADPPDDPVTWDQALRRPALLLQRSQLTLDALRELLTLPFINGGQNVYIDGLSSCSLDELMLRFAGESAPQPSPAARALFYRICVFVRLQRRLGWSAPDLDQVLAAFGAPPIRAETLVRLSHVKRIQARLCIALPELICWWADLSTARRGDAPSQFEALFLSNAVLPEAASGADWNDFARLVTDPPDPTRKISNCMPRVTAALSASSDDVSLLLRWTPRSGSGPQPLHPDWDALTVPNLSRLHRVLSMCRALKLTVREFTALLELRGRARNPLPARDLEAHPSEQTMPTGNLLRLLGALGRLRTSPFGVADLDYLLRHRFHSPETAEVDLRDAAATLEELRLGLLKIEGAAALTDAERNAEGRLFVKQHLAKALALEPALAEQLVSDWLRLSAHTTCLDALLAGTFVNGDSILREGFEEQKQVRVAYQPQFDAVTKLRKAALLIGRLHIATKAARHLFERTASTRVFDLDALPAQEQASTDSYPGWDRVIATCRLRDAIGTAAPDLFDLYDYITRGLPDAPLDLAPLAQRLGWDRDDLGALMTHFSVSRALLADEGILTRMAECFRLSRRLEVPCSGPSGGPPTLLEWASDSVTAPIARSIRHAAKAKYDDAQWLERAKPLQDVLRERKRQALVSYLTGSWQWTTERLYACYLIDVEMQPCMFTSRIKQAIGSVQLFVQRCLLGLEDAVELTPQAARWWTAWMKSYRVWEANRKIFAHPENWIEPELRDDKSPFFKELENELRQGDITAESSEKALLNYLEKLERVSHLEIVAQYHDAAAGRFHVFGRTTSTPHVYYTRARDGYGEWSAWEKIDLDIEGDHLIPVVWNRRLHLFWPLFKEATRKQQAPDRGEPVAQAQKSWEMRFAWSERWTDRWSPRKVTRTPLIPEGMVATSYLLVPNGVVPAFQARGPIPVLDPEELLQTTGYLYPGEPPPPCANEIKPTPYFSDAKNSGLFYVLPRLDASELRLCSYYVWNFFESTASPQRVRGHFVPVGDYRLAAAAGRPVDAGTGDIFLPLNGFGYVHGGRTFASSTAVRFEVPTPYAVENVEPGDVPAYTPSASFWILPSKQDFTLRFNPGGAAWFSPFVFQDDARTLLVVPTLEGTPLYSAADLTAALANLSGWKVALVLYGLEVDPTSTLGYQVEKLYHPYAAFFISEVNRAGAAGLLGPAPGSPLFRQAVAAPLFGDSLAPYSNRYERCLELHPGEAIEFDITSGESNVVYNWELFFHIPLLIAERLSTNQQFDEAQRWYHYIFDPTQVVPNEAPDRGAWRLKPFATRGEPDLSLSELMRALNGGDTGLENAVRQWRDNPFKPHLLARLRDGAPYMKTVVMKYIDNLIAWGDSLFRRDTIESINEATQLYVLASAILGPRPPELPEVGRDDYTYASLKDRLDDFGNAVVAIENAIVAAGPSELEAAAYQLLPATFSFEMALMPQAWAIADPQAAIAYARRYSMVVAGETAEPTSSGAQTSTATSDATAVVAAGEEFEFGVANNGLSIPLPTTLYFCLPVNSTLLGYWDTVADRLFKIRHCMNIAGGVRQLPLFEPPIEPGLLVRAAAAGVDLSAVLADVAPVRGPYRFHVLVQKAIELCAETKSLGAALLAALEKRDAEALSLMRSSHEVRLLDAADDIKRRQLEEAQAALKGLERARELTELRLEHYTSLEFLNPAERQQLVLMTAATLTQLVGQALQLAASGSHSTPTFTGGYASLGGVATASFGGGNVAGGLEASAWYFNSLSAMLNATAAQSGILGGYERRREEWDLQKRLAAKEIQQIEQQLIAAEIRVAMADREKENHALQREQAAEVNEAMCGKFTNDELYEWNISQLAALYFQSYQLACTAAKRAEAAYRFERGPQPEDEPGFIQPGYWENLKSGLLAGERLHHDLRRLENAYLERHTRELELTRHVSLALLDPERLITLKQTGSCTFDLPEHLFDLDFPGHYLRRIKNVSLSIPCVVGPYASLNATLRLDHHETRRSVDLRNDQYDRQEGDDNRFVDDWPGGAADAIAISHGQNDSGMFELDFHDERYLPFEGAGAISRWTLELSGKWEDESGQPQDFSQFDFETISDVILHLRYTAQDGGDGLRTAARAALVQSLAGQPQVRLFSLRHEFPNAWQTFMNPPAASPGAQSLTMTLAKDRFPFLFRGRNLEIEGFKFFVKVNPQFSDSVNDSSLKLSCAKEAQAGSMPVTLVREDGLLQGTAAAPDGTLGNWTLSMWLEPAPGVQQRIGPGEIENMGVLCFYKSS